MFDSYFLWLVIYERVDYERRANLDIKSLIHVHLIRLLKPELFLLAVFKNESSNCLDAKARASSRRFSSLIFYLSFSDKFFLS
jgi:hypothetical protein